jgi:predicted unusual protein kinase regulating ubiquinone biosynthesis (AarF/ABC1/UbiB family)
MTIGLAVLLIVLALVTTAWLVAGRRGLTRGRLGRLLRLGRLSARLSASWLGVRVRRAFASRERRARIDEERRRDSAAQVARTMGEMKGALMKLGQMVSFISDDVPVELRAALTSLQASAPPLDFPLVRDVVERELGRPLERAFARFDATPIAAASIGQVHRARLPDGEDVVVKVQYPGVAEAIAADLANVGVLYRFVALMYPALDPAPVVAELRGRIGEELDYAREADNQERFAARFAGSATIHVPRVLRSHSTARVLCAELATGMRFAAAVEAPAALRLKWGEAIYRFVFSSILQAGMFNGDPHPGNYLFHDDGRVTFLDFGCVKYFPPDMLRDWKQLVRCHLEHDPPAFRRQLVKLGFIPADSTLDAGLLVRYFAFFYAPFAEDREFTFTSDYNRKSLGMIFAPEGEFAGLSKKLNMPPDFVFVNRIQWGVWSILAQLGVTMNFHRIHREYLYDAEPGPLPHGDVTGGAAAGAAATS